jgi:integrase
MYGAIKMGMRIGKLSAKTVEALARGSVRAYHGDGGGLWLQVTAGGASWVFRYRVNGKLREMGLGPVHTIGLKEARERAQEARRQRLDGIDPIDARKAARTATKLAAAKAMTFRQCAEAYIDAHKAGWRNAKHRDQWPSSLRTYAYPEIGALPVAAVDVALVMKVLKPIWTAKPETASRVRGRIESVLDWATVSGFRQGDNPARWRGLLENLLPNKTKIRRVERHAALPYLEIGAFMTDLRAQEGVAACALEFAILTATRTGEVRGARWSEIDLTERVWTIPAERMKTGTEHRVPLSDAAMHVVEEMVATRSGEFVFPGSKARRSINEAAAWKVARALRPGITVHGFRATFSTWAGEHTHFPREVVEWCLAHATGNQVEAAYRRGDALAKRSLVMDAWAEFCAAPRPSGETVVPIRRRAAAE